MAALTRKQAKFVEELLIDLNASQAAARAGYSRKAATQIGHDLLKLPKVRAAVDAAMAERSKRTGIDAAWVLKRLAAEAEADLADLYGEDGCIKPLHDWPLIWRSGLISGVEIEERPEVGGRVTKIRLSDRVRRLELIGRHVDVNAFRDQVHHTGIPDNLGDRLARAKGRRSEDEQG